MYTLCLSLEFDHRGIRYNQEIDTPLSYIDKKIERYFRLDFLVKTQLVPLFPLKKEEFFENKQRADV